MTRSGAGDNYVPAPLFILYDKENKTMEKFPLKPINHRFIVLADDPEGGEIVENGVVVKVPELWRKNMDYLVLRGETDDFGIGDRVLLDSPNAGRKVKVDGVYCRVVSIKNIIGVIE